MARSQDEMWSASDRSELCDWAVSSAQLYPCRLPDQAVRDLMMGKCRRRLMPTAGFQLARR
jgi:hypothetical protein